MKLFTESDKAMSKDFHNKAIQEAKQAKTMPEKIRALHKAKQYRMWVALSR